MTVIAMPKTISSPSPEDVRAAKRRAIARARAQLEAGEGISEEEMAAWMDNLLASENQPPRPPKCD